MNLDLPRHVPRHTRELFETIRRSGRINDVVAEERAAAVELEIEITAIRSGLREKLHATVLPDFTAVFRPHAADEAIVNLEKSVNPMLIVEHPREGLRAMAAAFRSEMSEGERLRRSPDRVVPVVVRRRRDLNSSDSAGHVR